MDDVDQIIKKTKLRYEVIDSSFFNPDFEKKSVIEQIPQPSQKVKKNRKIYLTINPSGYGNVVLPNLIQLTKRNAESTLSALELEIGEISYEDNIGKDMVLKVLYMDTEINAGHIIPKKSKIDFVLGNGLKK